MEAAGGMPEPCIVCRDPKTVQEIIASLLARMAGTFGSSDVSESTVTVNGTAQLIVPAAAADVRYREISLQVHGDWAVYVKLNGVPTASLAAGEKILRASTSADDGNGGTLDLAGFMGEVRAITDGDNSDVAVTIANIR